MLFTLCNAPAIATANARRSVVCQRLEAAGDRSDVDVDVDVGRVTPSFL